jgi:Raf kinase inhibitor-like YbhB/YbcL family protein
MQDWLPSAICLLLLAGLASASSEAGPPMSFELRSSAFRDGQEIPQRYTCDGEDVSPPLSWGAPPAGTRSLALVVDDPDAPDPEAPRMTWVHWVVYGLPPAAGSLPEGVREQDLPDGARFGRNDWKRAAYGGPCPPIGRHRYYHKLYALDRIVDASGPLTKAQLEQAMQDHVLARSELVGTYRRGQRD